MELSLTLSSAIPVNSRAINVTLQTPVPSATTRYQSAPCLLAVCSQLAPHQLPVCLLSVLCSAQLKPCFNSFLIVLSAFTCLIRLVKVCGLACKNTHWYTLLQPFNGLFSRTTWVSRYQKSKTNLDFTGAIDSEWQWHPLCHMQVCTSLQTDNHASTPPLCFLQAGCPSCHPTNSVKALKALVHRGVEIAIQVFFLSGIVYF